MSRIDTFLILVFCLAFIKGQLRQTLCTKEDAQTFPSWCRHNNAFILPYLLTNLNQTLPPHLSEPVCDSMDQESNCYTILNIRPLERVKTNETVRVMTLSMANGNVVIIPFNDEKENTFESFKAHDGRIYFYDATSNGNDFHIVTGNFSLIKYHYIPDGDLSRMQVKTISNTEYIIRQIKILWFKNNIYLSILKNRGPGLYKIEFREWKTFETFSFDWNIFNSKTINFDIQIHYGDFRINSMTIYDAAKSRSLIMLNNDKEVKILEFAPGRNLNIKFGDFNSENSFYFSSLDIITTVHLMGETVRRVNQTISNCTTIFGNTPSQNMYLMIGLYNEETRTSSFTVRHIPEFAYYTFKDENPDPYNPARRMIPFNCVNGYFDENTRLCKTPWNYLKTTESKVLQIQTSYFGIERNFLRNPVSVCDLLLRVDYSLYLICRSLLTRRIECELNLIKTFGAAILQKFWFHHINLVHHDSVTIYGAQFSLNSTNELIIEPFNNLPLGNPILDFQVSPNGQHMFSTYARKRWQIDSIKRYGEICQILEDDPNNPFLIPYSEFCLRDIPKKIDINQFGHYASLCFPGMFCPSISNNLIYPVNEGFYTLLPRTMQICEPGYFCINGYRSKCPIGFICPDYKLSRPKICEQDPTGQTTCFSDGLNHPIKCPDGTKCDIPFFPPLPISPGHYVNKQKEIKKCQPGDWCSLGRFSTNGTGLLCPQDTYCKDPSVIQPSICQSNVTQLKYCPAGSITDGLCPPGYYCENQYTKKNCSITEYCPTGTYVPKPCPRGYFCPNASLSYICPQGYYCKSGADQPTKCSLLSICLEGSTDEGNYYIFAFTIFGVILILSSFYIFQLIGYYMQYLMRSRSDNTRISFGKSIKRYTIDIAFENLGVELRDGKKVLQNVSGEFKHGRLTAVMGLSGSGKTTFLTTLSGRQWTGKVSGNVFFNGKKVNISNFYKLVGFVPQEDIMLRTLTVYETLYFAARTKLNWRKSNHEIEMLVNQVIEELGLEDCRDSIIGDEEKRGISGGQRKRVNIGIELVSDPSVLFLDEPTSGLDASAANEVCIMLQRIAKTGIPVITVIHQPRYEIFSMFDDLLLLGKGGKIVYLGPCSEAVNYFEKLGFKCPPKVNPADFLMDVTNGDIEREGEEEFTIQTLFDKWETYPKEEFQQKVQTSIQEDVHEVQIHTLDDEYAKKKTSFFIQLWNCFKRALIQQMRNTLSLILEMLLLFIPGLTLGLVFSDKEYKGPLPPHIIQLCPKDLQPLCGAPLDDNLLYLVVLLTCSTGLTGVMSSLKNFGGEKVVFSRESTSGMQSFPYFLAKNIAQLPNILLGPCIYMCLFYTLASPKGYFYEYYFVILHLYFAAYGFGYLLSIIFDENVAKLAGVVCILLFQMLSGGGPTLPEFEKMSPPMRYGPWFSFSRWGMEMLYIIEITKYEKIYNINPSLKTWGYKPQNFWMNYGILIGYGIFFRILAYLALLSFQPTSYVTKFAKFFLDLIYMIKLKVLIPIWNKCSRKKQKGGYMKMEDSTN